MENQVGNDTGIAQEFDPQMVEAVRKQIEYYFSKENLQSDVYLTSQMDAQMSVPISVVMKFAKLKALTQDESVVRRALTDSTVTTVVDNRIRANIKSSGRSTIILREIPSDAAEEEVKEIFNYPGCKPISSIRSDIGDTWFVTLETEDDAKDTALDLRLKKRTFRGQPVKARIKTENVVRSYFPVPSSVTPPAVAYPPMMPFPPVVPPSMIDLSSFGYIPVPPPVDPNLVSPTSVTPPVDHAATNAADSSIQEPASPDTATEENDKTIEEGTEPSAGQDKSSSRGIRENTRKPVRGREVVREAVDTRRKTETRRVTTPNSKEYRTDKKVEVPAKPPIEVNAMTFPPLHGLEDTPVPTPGYKESYLKFTSDAIIAIVKNVKEATLPISLNPTDHPLAMTASPNMDLLKRQRTFSIDETREQLRQGRPVQREAIISGSVDYRSLMFGDDQDMSKLNKGLKTDVPSSSSVSKNTDDSEVARTFEEQCNVEIKPDSKVEATVQSPQRITASTWAAMVKSSAESQPSNGSTQQTSTFQRPLSTTPVKHNDNNQTKKESVKSQATDSSDKSVTKSEKSFERNFKGKEDKAQLDRRSHHRGDRRKKGITEDSKKAGSGDSENKDQDSISEGNVQSHENSTASGTWGKGTFANVLKQALPEDGSEEAVINHSGKKSGTSSEQNSPNSPKPLKMNSRVNGLKDDNRNSHHHHRSERKQRDYRGQEKDYRKRHSESTDNTSDRKEKPLEEEK